MTDKEKLEVYDQLRKAHKILDMIDAYSMELKDRIAIVAVDNVLYLAEGHFARMSE